MTRHASFVTGDGHSTTRLIRAVHRYRHRRHARRRGVLPSFPSTNSHLENSARDGTTWFWKKARRAYFWRQTVRTLGEFLREAAVLVAVLAPLESLVTHRALTATGIVATVVVAMPCLVLGIVLGLER